MKIYLVLILLMYVDLKYVLISSVIFGFQVLCLMFLSVCEPISIINFSFYQCWKKRSTRPINHRLGATGPPTLPIYVTGSNKKVNRGQRRSMAVNGGQTCRKPTNLAGSTQNSP